MNFIQTILSQTDIGIFQEQLAQKKELKVGIPAGALAFVFAKLCDQTNVIYLTGDEMEAENAYESIRSATSHVLLFPDIDVIPFTNVYASMDKMADRMRALFELRSGNTPRIIVTTIESFYRKLPPRDYLKKAL